MVQREVADRLFASPSTKAYGAVSVLVQLAAERTGFHPVSRDGLPAAARTSTRRSSRSGASASPTGIRDVKRVVEAAFAHRRKTLPNSLQLAGLATAGARRGGARGARPRAVGPRRGARARGVRRARGGAPVNRAPGHREAQPRPRRRPARGPTGSTRSRPCSSGSRSATASRVEPAARLSVRGSPRTRSSARRCERLAAEARRRSRAGRRRSTKKHPGRGRARRRQLRRRRRRCGSRTRPSPSRSRPSGCTPSPPSSARTSRSSSRRARSSARATAASSSPLELPQDYWVVLLLPDGAREALDRRGLRRVRRAAAGRRASRSAAPRSLDALAGARRARDLAALPRNDLAASPLAAELEERGAFRADVTGAGPVVYGLFLHRDARRRRPPRPARPRTHLADRSRLVRLSR